MMRFFRPCPSVLRRRLGFRNFASNTPGNWHRRQVRIQGRCRCRVRPRCLPGLFRPSIRIRRGSPSWRSRTRRAPCSPSTLRPCRESPRDGSRSGIRICPRNQGNKGFQRTAHIRLLRFGRDRPVREWLRFLPLCLKLRCSRRFHAGPPQSMRRLPA